MVLRIKLVRNIFSPKRTAMSTVDDVRNVLLYLKLRLRFCHEGVHPISMFFLWWHGFTSFQKEKSVVFFVVWSSWPGSETIFCCLWGRLDSQEVELPVQYSDIAHQSGLYGGARWSIPAYQNRLLRHSKEQVYSSPLKRCFQSGILVLLSYNYCNKVIHRQKSWRQHLSSGCFCIKLVMESQEKISFRKHSDRLECKCSDPCKTIDESWVQEYNDTL